MSIHLPYIAASFDNDGLIADSSFNIQFNSYDAENALFGLSTEETEASTVFDLEWQSKNPGVTPLFIMSDIYEDNYTWALNVPGDTGLSSPSFSSFEEVSGVIVSMGGRYSVSYASFGYGAVYLTKMSVDYAGDIPFLSDTFNKYGSNSEYSNFTNALEGITSNLINETNNLLNQGDSILIFKKTTQKPIDVGNASALRLATSAQIEETDTEVTTTATTTYSSGGGGGY